MTLATMASEDVMVKYFMIIVISLTVYRMIPPLTGSGCFPYLFVAVNQPCPTLD